jgi:hypothetical protein
MQALVKIYFTANILQYLILHNTAGGSEYCNNIVESDVNCSSTVLFIHNFFFFFFLTPSTVYLFYMCHKLNGKNTILHDDG